MLICHIDESRFCLLSLKIGIKLTITCFTAIVISLLFCYSFSYVFLSLYNEAYFVYNV